MEPIFLVASVNGTWDVILLLFGMFMVYVGGPVLLLAGGVQVILLVVGWASGVTKSPSYASVRRAPSHAETLPWDEILAEPELAAAVRPQRVAISVLAIPAPGRVPPLVLRRVVWFPQDGLPWLRTSRPI